MYKVRTPLNRYNTVKHKQLAWWFVTYSWDYALSCWRVIFNDFTFNKLFPFQCYSIVELQCDIKVAQLSSDFTKWIFEASLHFFFFSLSLAEQIKVFLVGCMQLNSQVWEIISPLGWLVYWQWLSAVSHFPMSLGIHGNPRSCSKFIAWCDSKLPRSHQREPVINWQFIDFINVLSFHSVFENCVRSVKSVI